MYWNKFLCCDDLYKSLIEDKMVLLSKNRNIFQYLCYAILNEKWKWDIWYINNLCFAWCCDKFWHWICRAIQFFIWCSGTFDRLIESGCKTVSGFPRGLICLLTSLKYFSSSFSFSSCFVTKYYNNMSSSHLRMYAIII